jgi:branched-subunit amino acid transport protein
MIADTTNIWLVIFLLAASSFLIRFSFLGFLGGRELPEWALRHLRYVAVAVMPGLIAPLVVWPAANDGIPEPTRLIAALIAFAIGMWFRSVIGAVFGGMITLYALQFLLG